MRKKLDAKTLRALFDYEPKTGRFIWYRVPSNQVNAGQEAGWIENKGYRRICIGGKNYQAHRLAWLYMTGRLPSRQIDHRNLCKSDNRWSNLRLATNAQNQHNTVAKRTNTSGFKGVYWHVRRQKWQASISVNNRLIFLGYRAKKDDARKLYQNEARRLRGQFARV